MVISKRPGEIQIMLVDDQELIRAAMKAMLDGTPGMKVIAEAASGEEALKLARELKPDIILMDVKMPGIGGLEATRRLVQIDKDLRVLVVTACESEVYATKLLQVGAAGYLTKGSKREDMVRAIQTVAAGQRYISPEISNVLALKNVNDKDLNPFEQLSERELQVALMIAHGTKVAEISEKLHLSSKTVNSYRYRIFEKLNIQNDVEMTLLALRHALIELDEVKF